MACPDGRRRTTGALRVADADDVDMAPSGEGDEEGAAFLILTCEDPAQLSAEVWPEDGQQAGMEARDLRDRGREFTSGPGGGGEIYSLARFCCRMRGVLDRVARVRWRFCRTAPEKLQGHFDTKTMPGPATPGQKPSPEVAVGGGGLGEFHHQAGELCLFSLRQGGDEVGFFGFGEGDDELVDIGAGGGEVEV